MQLKNPLIVGFGIKDKSTFQSACKYSNGAVIGTGYIQALEKASDIQSATKTFLSSIIA
jgi:tryptophan synthase alpha chain